MFRFGENVIYTGNLYSKLEYGKTYIIIECHFYSLGEYCSLEGVNQLRWDDDKYFLTSQFNIIKGYIKLKLQKLCSISEM